MPNGTRNASSRSAEYTRAERAFTCRSLSRAPDPGFGGRTATVRSRPDHTALSHLRMNRGSGAAHLGAGGDGLLGLHHRRLRHPPPIRHRGVSEPVWVLIVVLLPVLGGILWLVVGRSRQVPKGARRAPDDDPEFLGASAPSATRTSGSGASKRSWPSSTPRTTTPGGQRRPVPPSRWASAAPSPGTPGAPPPTRPRTATTIPAASAAHSAERARRDSPRRLRRDRMRRLRCWADSWSSESSTSC